MPPLAQLLIVVAVAFAVPLALALVPRLPIPAAVAELAVGIGIGPDVLGWAAFDVTVEVLALIGLAFLLMLAGLETDLGTAVGAHLRRGGLAYVFSLALAGATSVALAAAGVVESPLLLTVVLSATALGVVIPVLDEAGRAGSPFGRLVVVASTIADIASIVLLSVLFSTRGGPGASAVLLAGLFAVAAAVGVLLRREQRHDRVRRLLARLEGTSAQIRVRGAVLVLVGFAALAVSLGFEVIIGAFVAGVVIGLIDGDGDERRRLRPTLEVIGNGIFVPVFFVASGLAFDLDALLDEPANLALVPLFVLALLLVRGVPAALYRPALTGREAGAAGLLQATTLPFVVAATTIGVELGLMDRGEQAALIGAGLISVLVFPALALVLLSSERRPVNAGAVPWPARRPAVGGSSSQGERR